jgi:regulation of enolase protein 1 (concanavalin A-like superfamily)
MRWLNEPPSWKETGDEIAIVSGAQTDFWRRTHDGGLRDSGHFYHRTVEGDFQAEVLISGRYRDLYDQAGLMVRVDETAWLKCGVEFVDGVQHASVVVTREYSDWSVVPLTANPEAVGIRVRRHENTFAVHYSADGGPWILQRQAYLTDRPAVEVGVMSASPTGLGFSARLRGLRIRD